MPSIGDLAERTGLSTATVSRYLNGKPYVSKEAQYSIELAIRELGYRPNASARSLRSGKTGRLLLLVKDAALPFYSALISGVGSSALTSGYDILVQQSSGGDGWRDRLIELATTRAVDGIIASTALEPWELFEPALEGVPLYSCDQAVDRPEIPGVYIDHLRSTVEGLEYLYSRGCRRFGCFHAPQADSCASSSRRMAGYSEFEARHPEVSLELFEIDDDRLESGYALFERIQTSDVAIDGVFAGSDELAAGLLQAAREAGIAVPGSLRILGFDEQPISRILGITTVRQPIEKMGEMAARKLIERLEAGRPGKPERYRVRYRLIERESA